ncbi:MULTISPECIES: YihY/virulence factor BrkB family protein [unclassified Oceanobacillus]|uniref:YihY/virulence factor BrkB family protein n=1 Tax=unclassified Oceanobacillus TaxID=2630292 RepID=UPI00300DDD1B
MGKIKGFGKELLQKLKEDNITFLAAALAYYFLLAIFPLLIVGFAIIPYFNISADDALGFFSTVLPGEIASLFEENIVSLVETPRGGLLTVGIIGALWSASGGINAFIKSSNEAFDVEETRSFITVHLISLGLTIGLIISVIVAILLPVLGDVILRLVGSVIGLTTGMGVLLHILRWLISIIVLTTFIMLLYRFAPNKKISFKHIIPGALVASLLWQIISFGFSIYVSNFGNYSATYGTLGGVIILMTWFFLTGLILMLGASITVIYHRYKTHNATELHKAANI